jgi:hypothetical protein
MGQNRRGAIVSYRIKGDHHVGRSHLVLNVGAAICMVAERVDETFVASESALFSAFTVRAPARPSFRRRRSNAARMISQIVGLSMPGDQGQKMRSTATTIWNSTMPMMDRMINAPQASPTWKKAVEVWIR